VVTRNVPQVRRAAEEGAAARERNTRRHQTSAALLEHKAVLRSSICLALAERLRAG
jgi:hypothetical protein